MYMHLILKNLIPYILLFLFLEKIKIRGGGTCSVSWGPSLIRFSHRFRSFLFKIFVAVSTELHHSFQKVKSMHDMIYLKSNCLLIPKHNDSYNSKTFKHISFQNLHFLSQKLIPKNLNHINK